MIDELVAHHPARHDLETLAKRAGYEATHFHKLFTRHVGITPKQFQNYLHLKHARDLLQLGLSTEYVADKVNLSSTGRLYDLFTVHEAVRPGDVQKRGQDLTVTYGWHATSLGDLLIATTPRGICWLGFRVENARAETLRRLRNYWPQAQMIEDVTATSRWAELIEKKWLQGDDATPLPLDIHGTNFQLQVWRALLRIPHGALVSYRDVARGIGKPTAARAVGTAVGDNPISLLIPCHRVIQSSGIIENYGWGSDRKRVLIGIEGIKK